MPEEHWDLVIEPHRRWLSVDLAELWRYRDLVLLFVQRNFVTRYKQTVLGPLWYLLQPLLTTVIFTVVFGKIARIPTDGVPPFLFYLAGTVVWRYFADCLTQTADTFAANAGVFGKVYFPRLTVPTATVVSNLFQFLIQLLLFGGFAFYFGLGGTPLHPNAWILALPLIVAQAALISLGAGLLIAAATARYRDLRYALQFLVQLWMYASPVVYPLSQVPEAWRSLYALNPVVPVIEIFRYATLGAGSVTAAQVAGGLLVTVVLLLLGILAFNRVERTFMDTI